MPTTTPLKWTQAGAGAALIDGTPYHVAVVGFDEFGNASMNVTSSGPVYSRNDTALLTTLEMHYGGFADDENFGQGSFGS